MGGVVLVAAAEVVRASRSGHIRHKVGGDVLSRNVIAHAISRFELVPIPARSDGSDWSEFLLGSVAGIRVATEEPLRTVEPLIEGVQIRRYAAR